jgi:23S rRNA pseudouridine2605 synthase
MRINQFVAQASGMSRRAADRVISDGRVTINGQVAKLGQTVASADQVRLDREVLKVPTKMQTIIFNKPPGYVVSRDGQGSKTIFDILPPDLRRLKPVGRLDKYSSGLLLLTSDGGLANELLHPRYAKEKVYKLTIDKALSAADRRAIQLGVKLEDGKSRLALSGSDKKWEVKMHEGRNRQIRRTFEALGYRVLDLHRISFGKYDLGEIATGSWLFV